MLEISVTKIKSKTDELRKQIRKYEEYAMTIAQQIQNSETEWYDDNSASFFELVNNQKRIMQCFISELDSARNKYINVVEVVLKTNNKIKELRVDETKQKGIMYYYDQNIASLNSIVSSIDDLDTSKCTTSERYILSNERSRIKRAISKLENTKTSLTNLFTQYATVEESIKTILSRIEVTPIRQIDFGKFYK